MKKKFALLLALTMALTLVACSSKESVATETGTEAETDTKDNVLVVYTARSESLNNAVIENFEKDTGIKVEVVTGSTGELLKRVQSEAGNPQGDIFWAADESMLSGSTELFESYVSPEDSNMMEGFQNTTGYFSVAFADPTVFIVNTDLAGDMEINGFEDLLNPELKGKIAYGDPVNSSSAFQCLMAGLYDMGKDGDPMSDDAWAYVDSFIENLDGVCLDSSSQVYKGVAEGEYVVGLTWEDPVAAYVRDGVAVKCVFPEEGAIIPGESVSIIKGCKSIDSAKLFVDYMQSEACQNFVGQNLTVRPLRKDATLSDCLIPWDQINPIENYDGNWVAENKGSITEKYTEHMELSMD